MTATALLRRALRRPRPGDRVRVTVYTRAGCGLCRDAERTVARVARRADVRIVDVDAEPGLTDRYTVRVPVVEVDGSEVCELGCAPGQLRRALRSARDRRLRVVWR